LKKKKKRRVKGKSPPSAIQPEGKPPLIPKESNAEVKGGLQEAGGVCRGMKDSPQGLQGKEEGEPQQKKIKFPAGKNAFWGVSGQGPNGITGGVSGRRGESNRGLETKKGEESVGGGKTESPSARKRKTWENSGKKLRIKNRGRMTPRAEGQNEKEAGCRPALLKLGEKKKQRRSTPNFPQQGGRKCKSLGFGLINAGEARAKPLSNIEGKSKGGERTKRPKGTLENKW